MNKTLSSIFAVFLKEFKSELRTRYSVFSLILFVITAITIIAVSNTQENMSVSSSAGLLWVLMFFSAMTGLAKSFISEEERGTYLYLQLVSTPTAIYFGKMIFNIMLCILMNFLVLALFFLFVAQQDVNSFFILFLSVLTGSFAFATASNLISALIQKANSKGALFPVLSFPILLPILLLGIETTKTGIEGGAFSEMLNNFLLIFSYTGIVIIAGFLLFEYIWKD